MASLIIAALPVQTAATVLHAATSRSPIRAANTDLVEGDIASFAFLYLAVKIRSLCQLGPPDEKTSAETAFVAGSHRTLIWAGSFRRQADDNEKICAHRGRDRCYRTS